MTTDRDVFELKGCSKVVTGLLWKEWLEHSKLLSISFPSWLICVWIIQLFNSPIWILAFSGIYALCVGYFLGGCDIQNTTEEFSLSLPPIRKEIFFVRFFLGAIPLIFVIGTAILAIRFNLPQRIWGVFVESGFTEPFDPTHTSAYYLAITFPLATFTQIFAISIVTNKKNMEVGTSWSLGLIDTVNISLAGLTTEKILFADFTGDISSCALIIVSALNLTKGYYIYLHRESVIKGINNNIQKGSRIILLIVLLVLLINIHTKSLFDSVVTEIASFFGLLILPVITVTTVISLLSHRKAALKNLRREI